MLATQSMFQDSMENCFETNNYFARIFQAGHAFLQTDDWKDTVKTNYAANKAEIDQDWKICLDNWTWGNYFNSGMYYETVWLKLTGIAPIM